MNRPKYPSQDPEGPRAAEAPETPGTPGALVPRATNQRRPKARRKKYYQRTRERERVVALSTQLDVNSLRQEIINLSELRTLLYARAFNRRDQKDGSYAKVVDMYYRVTRNGYYDQVWDNDSNQMVDSRSFLMANCDENIASGKTKGIHAFIGALQQVTVVADNCELTHSALEILDKSHDLERDPNDDVHGYVVVRVKAAFRGTITLRTLSIMCPHVLAFPAVVNRLIGRELIGHGTADFRFDSASHRIVRHDVETNVAMVFMQMLGGAEEVASMLAGPVAAPLEGESSNYDDQGMSPPHAQNNAASPHYISDDGGGSAHDQVPSPVVSSASSSLRKMNMKSLLSPSEDEAVSEPINQQEEETEPEDGIYWV